MRLQRLWAPEFHVGCFALWALLAPGWEGGFGERLPGPKVTGRVMRSVEGGDRG